MGISDWRAWPCKPVVQLQLTEFGEASLSNTHARANLSKRRSVQARALACVCVCVCVWGGGGAFNSLARAFVRGVRMS